MENYKAKWFEFKSWLLEIVESKDKFSQPDLHEILKSMHKLENDEKNWKPYKYRPKINVKFGDAGICKKAQIGGD